MELSAKRDDFSPVLTRTIGDPLTGTDALLQSTHEETSPTSEHWDLPPNTNVTQQGSDGVRPNYLKLPEPRDFSLQPPTSSTSTSSTLVPQVTGNGNSTPPASAGFEHGIRVLVVDDDPLTRKLMSRMLTRIGCRVSTAENGEMALEMILGMHSRVTPSSEETGSGGLSSDGGAGGGGAGSSIRASTGGGGGEEYKYAIVFLDNQMPVMSGLDAVAKLREIGRHDFVVGVTGECLHPICSLGGAHRVIRRQRAALRPTGVPRGRRGPVRASCITSENALMLILTVQRAYETGI